MSVVVVFVLHRVTFPQEHSWYLKRTLWSDPELYTIIGSSMKTPSKTIPLSHAKMRYSSRLLVPKYEGKLTCQSRIIKHGCSLKTSIRPLSRLLGGCSNGL